MYVDKARKLKICDDSIVLILEFDLIFCGKISLGWLWLK